jgi:hypothetical protein
MIQIILAIFGIVALVKGEFKITSNRKVSGSVGKALGVLMLLGAALPLVAGSQTIIPLGTLVLVIIIGLATSEKIEKGSQEKGLLPGEAGFEEAKDGSPQVERSKEFSRMAEAVAQISSKSEAVLGIKIVFVDLKDNVVKLRVSEIESGLKNVDSMMWNSLGSKRQIALEMGAEVGLGSILKKKVEIDNRRPIAAADAMDVFMNACSHELAKKFDQLLNP